MHDPRARSVVYLRHAPYISPSLRTGPGQTRDCWYKSMALMLFFVRYTRHRLGWSAAPLASLSECNRDGSTRFFTLNTDPSRIKQELFLFISCGPISPPGISHFHQFSEAVFGFWYFPIISKNFQGNQYSRSKRRWWHLNKKVYTLFDILKWGQFAMDFLLENISFQLKVDILEYFQTCSTLRILKSWESTSPASFDNVWRARHH